MPLFALTCIDKPGHLDLRKSTRGAHLAHIDTTGVVQQAGPFLDEAGEMCGSLVIIDVADLSAARDWAARDPYARAGLFERVDIREWKRVIG